MKAYLIDLDGTIYMGTKPCEGAIDFISYLLRKEIPFAFFTNNSSRTQGQAREHMEALGFTGLQDHHFFTSALAASKYVASISDKRRAFVIGERGLTEALEQEGFAVVEEHADFVFVGLDKAGNYMRYSQGLAQLMQGAQLVGTNNDRRLLLETGPHIGNGSIVHMMEYASGQESIKVGKPHEPMLLAALAYLGKTKDECVILGDNLETDILCGTQAGVDTILVLGGIHDEQDCERLHIHPTRIAKTLRDLMIA